jgi:hypothetical protein
MQLGHSLVRHEAHPGMLVRVIEDRRRPEYVGYVSCQVCKLPPAWFHLSYPAINCGCSVTSSVRSNFANDPALK